MSLQGAPRTGRRHVGVPVGGAFDLESMVLANALLRNGAFAPCMELGLATVELSVVEDGAFAWVGAGATNGCRMVSAGEKVVLQAPGKGCRSYLALPGGVRGEIRRGGVLEAMAPIGKVPPRHLTHGLRSLGEEPLRIVRGPNAGLLNWEGLVTESFLASQAMDRTGVRTVAAPLMAHEIELDSGPACVGAVQVTPDGTLILIGPDGPTIGGYPKIGVVASVDHGRLGQIRPGDEIRFWEVSIGLARQFRAEADKELERKVRLLRI